MKLKIFILFNFLIFISLSASTQTAEDYYNQAKEIYIKDKAEAKNAIIILSKAIDICKQAKEIYSKDKAGEIIDSIYKEALLLRAEIYENTTSYKEEIADLTTLIQLDISNAIYYKKRAMAYYLKKEADKSIEDYSKAFELDTSMIECVYERAIIYTEYYFEKKSKQAINDFDFCIKHGSINIKSLSYFKRGFLYENMGEYDKSLADYNTALKINPLNTEVYLYRGLLKINMNQNGCYDLLKYRDMNGADAQEYMKKFCYK